MWFYKINRGTVILYWRVRKVRSGDRLASRRISSRRPMIATETFVVSDRAVRRIAINSEIQTAGLVAV